MHQKNISLLIVDDEESIMTLLGTALGDHYNCVTTESAEEATRLLETTRFNLVITDIRMPGASGLELCQLVTKTYPGTVVMVISGMTDIQFAIESTRQGAFEYVTKPFELPNLMVLVERARASGLLLQNDLFATLRFASAKAIQSKFHRRATWRCVRNRTNQSHSRPRSSRGGLTTRSKST